VKPLIKTCFTFACSPKVNSEMQFHKNLKFLMDTLV